MCVNPLGDTPTMTRPNKILSETMSYNLTIETKDHKELKEYSAKETERFNQQISVADLIRTSVKLYLDDLKQVYEEKNGTSTNRD